MSETLSTLQNFEPFSFLAAEELELIEDGLQEVTFNRTSIIYQQHTTRIEGLDIIIEGAFESFFFTSEGQKVVERMLGPGETYGAFSILLNKGKSIKTVNVRKNTHVYRIPADTFKALCKDNEPFYQYFLSAFGREMLDDQFANHATPAQLSVEAMSVDRYFTRRLDSVVPQPLHSCTPDTTVHDAALRMEQQRISCLFVKEGDRLTGYITDIILRNKVIGERRSPDTHVGEIMEGPVYNIDRRAFVYEAILLMFNKRIRYLVVLDEQKVVGVVNRNKLMSDNAASPFVFIQSVRMADSIEALRSKWAEVPEIVFNLLSRGIKARLVNRVISHVADTIAVKVINGVIEEIGRPPARFAFMVLGSEGRMEQTLKTDQDNAIIYADKANAFRAKTRKYFLHFAELVSERLNDVGFSFCTGGLMAKNPKWTHSLSHWKKNYNKWIEERDHEAAMNFSTFFDCRLLYGDPELIEELQSHILDKLDTAGEFFFKQLADNALQYVPPLTFFKGIRTVSKGDQQVFNIKHAMTPIVDLVRVYALRHKILLTNTGERMAALKEAKVFTDTEYQELLQSYYYLMAMRLKYQARQIIHNDEEPHNYVSPDALTKIEIVTLKEIFKVIANFQQGVKMVFTRTLF